MTGLIVTGVVSNSEAAKIGIQPGMIIRSINRVPVNTVEDFKKVYDSVQKGASMLILITTPNGSQYITLNK